MVVATELGMDSQVRDSHVKEEETPLDLSECPQKKWRLYNGSKALDSLKEERHKLTSRVTKMRNLQQTFYLNPSQKKKSPSCKRASRTLQTSALAFKHNRRSHSRPRPSSNRRNNSQSNNNRTRVPINLTLTTIKTTTTTTAVKIRRVMQALVESHLRSNELTNGAERAKLVKFREV